MAYGESPGSHEGGHGGDDLDRRRQQEKDAAAAKAAAINGEILQVLNGSRSTKFEIMQKCAVRLLDLKGLEEMPPVPQSYPSLTTTPTAFEMNLLINDVITIFNQLAIVADALRKRGTPAEKAKSKPHS
jgi:hypothetical protein